MLCLCFVSAEKLGQLQELLLLKKQEVIKTVSNKKNNINLNVFIFESSKINKSAIRLPY